MGRNSYLGGHTVIGSHTPEWFGYGAESHSPGEAHLEALANYERLCGERVAGRRGRHFRRKLAAAKEAVEQTRPKPPVRNGIAPNTEHRIAELKRELSIKQHYTAEREQALREELARLLASVDIPTDGYPELQ